MGEGTSSQRPPPKTPGCGQILLIMLAFFFLKTNYSTVSRLVGYLTINLRSGDDVARKYLETNPWPNTPEDAVRKCFFAIEARNWDDYKNCFEPSAVLDQISPGPPGKFYNMRYSLLDKDNGVAIVSINGEWHPSAIVAADYKALTIQGTVIVVQASKGVLKDVKLPLVDIPLSKKGWFIADSESSKLPYNFGEQSNGALVVDISNAPTFDPTPTLVATVTPTPLKQTNSISSIYYIMTLLVLIFLGAFVLSRMARKSNHEEPSPEDA